MDFERDGSGAGAPFLKPTVVQHIRGFLGENGIVSKPWDGAREVLDRLLSCIGERIGEPAFRKRLGLLLGEIVEGGGALSMPESEILRQAEVSAMIADIERALAPEGASARHGLLERLQAPAVCCLLLVAMAAGCDSKEGTGGRESAPPATGTPAKTSTPTKTEAAPFDVNGKSVLDYVQRTNLPGDMKARLSEKLRAMADSERKALIDLFRTKKPEEIVSALEAMALVDERERGRTESHVLYKGISFPARRA